MEEIKKKLSLTYTILLILAVSITMSNIGIFIMLKDRPVYPETQTIEIVENKMFLISKMSDNTTKKELIYEQK